MSRKSKRSSVRRRANMSEEKRKPIAPYMAVGLSTVVYGIAQRKHIKYNLKTVEENILKSQRNTS